jgi:MerR family transcriptional regulator, copper efflux regulator
VEDLTMTKLMGIGEVAKRSNVGIETVRFYEREGLLAEPERRPSGYRQYDDSVVSRLQFIRRTKELGFTLAEIRDLLGLWFDQNSQCQHVRKRAEQKITGIDSKIASLKDMKRSLEKLIRICRQRNSKRACPLLEGIEEAVK